MSLEHRLVAAWFGPRNGWLPLLLSPLANVFRAVVAARQHFYRIGVIRTHAISVPVVVIGNITVGGSGKTPLTLALARALSARGWHPSIVSRGYGGSARQPTSVHADTDPALAGDEAVLMARRGIPVWIGRDRPATARQLLAMHPECDVILCDDGLQHYALQRDVEVAVVDGERGLGNGRMLPAGPLREPATRLGDVDAVVVLGSLQVPLDAPISTSFSMRLDTDPLQRVNAPQITAPVNDFKGGTVHAVAGIGAPERFFAQLRALGITAIGHAFPDHHRFTPADLRFPDARAILMTEKDAVKCMHFADDRCWALPVHAVVDAALPVWLDQRLRARNTRP